MSGTGARFASHLPKDPKFAVSHPTAYHRSKSVHREVRVNGFVRSACLLFGTGTLIVLGSLTLQAQLQDQQPASRPHSQKNFGEDHTSPRIYQKWLTEDVAYIITDRERADFQKLTTAEQCDKFVEEFWERRNPIPGSQENTFKEEHYRRLAYTNQHFAANVPGWRTDHGRIYILYGPPDEREQHPGRTDLGIPESAPLNVRYPSDVWRYHYIDGVGRDVVFEFIDTCRCGKFELHNDPTKKLSSWAGKNEMVLLNFN